MVASPHVCACVAAAVLLRLLVATFPYSGAQTPPKYGDYEAQRHWMELTTNLPVQHWYQDGADNDPKYWPLDYPPLSGFQSYVHGLFVGHFDPSAVALHSSRGYETPFSKQLMRGTVLLSDLLIFFPAAYLASTVFARQVQKGSSRTAAAAVPDPQQQLFILAAMLLQPVLVLTDHGHFQYNCISLGLSALAATVIAAGHDVLGSILFSLALNHKQMTLFFAPAFFAHLLGKCLQRPSIPGKVFGVARLGLAVIATFVVCWSPWLVSLDSFSQVLRRIFPVGRGLYEDYLANFWCTTSVAIKWRQLFSGPRLMPVCAGLTLLSAAPSMLHQMMRPSAQGLLLGMANSGLSFFMFSFQVHEKSILLPLLPLTMLAAWEPDIAIWGPVVGALQMYPLLLRDGVAVAYAACIASYITLMTAVVPKGVMAYSVASPKIKIAAAGGLTGAVVLHVLQLTLNPPARLPWLFDRLYITYSFVFVAAAMVYLNYRQWSLPHKQAGTARAQKKVQ